MPTNVVIVFGSISLSFAVSRLAQMYILVIVMSPFLELNIGHKCFNRNEIVLVQIMAKIVNKV